MGTNYYWTQRTNECSHCNRYDEEQLHIGKSSAGWCFSLHIIPERDISSLEDWQRLWASGGIITDEYGDAISADEMTARIVDRSWGGDPLDGHTQGGSPPDSLSRGLVRHRVTDRPTYSIHYVAHGPGTWDLVTGEFS